MSRQREDDLLRLRHMRDFLFHDYAGIDDNILWDTATIEVPRLLEQVEAILGDEG
jgi:uncharacterized protein with HEPN domain